MADTGLTEDLIARVEAAAGPDRELDAEIAAFFRCHPYGPDHWLNRSPEITFRPTVNGWLCIDAPGDIAPRDSWGAPEFTASIDAALGLVERLLPGWRLHSLQQLRGIEGEPDWSCALRNDNLRDPDRIWAEGRSAPIAIILALLRAITASRNTAKQEPAHD